jgi:hypothetical protein
LSAHWHVQTEDRAQLAAELKALETRVYELDEAMREAVYRQRYSGEPEATAKGADDLWHLVRKLDWVMTRVRAVEAKLLLLEKMNDRVSEDQWEPGEGEAAAMVVAASTSDRLAVEVHRDVPSAHGRGSK